MNRPFLFELCVETLDAVRISQECGVSRVELCAQLQVGGITPDLALVKAAVQAVSLPVHILVRPRAGNFVFSEEEFEQMEHQIIAVKKAGAAGVVLGTLSSEGRIDIEGTRRLIKLARPMKVTFHRAFDEARDQLEALEEVIATAADCLLTSGGAPNVLSGVDCIAQLREQAKGRIEIMAGGGLTLASLTEVAEQTGVTAFHASLRRKNIFAGKSHLSDDYPSDILSKDIVESLQILDNAFAHQTVGEVHSR